MRQIIINKIEFSDLRKILPLNSNIKLILKYNKNILANTSIDNHELDVYFNMIVENLIFKDNIYHIFVN